jgi:hypothetical protein
MPGVPNTFANASGSIPLSQLDANFNTTLTIGTTSVGLGNTISTISNVAISTGSVNGSPVGNVTPSSGAFTTLSATGNVTVADGTVSVPAIAFTSDTDSGIYRIGANNIGIGVNGANAIDISSSKISALNAYQKLSSSGTVVNINGTYHEIVSNFNTNVLVITNQNATLNTTISGINVYYSGAAPNSTTACFLYNEDTGGLRSSLRSNGGLANYSANNVNLSDERLKKDIVDAPSYYERWKQLQFRTFLYKDQTDSELNLGVIAQELETVCPELVSNDGFGETPPGETPLKTVYQTDFQYATAKALQELMLKFEALQAEFNAYKAAHP